MRVIYRNKDIENSKNLKGFITIATGSNKYYQMAQNLVKSYKKNGNCSLPFAIICDKELRYERLSKRDIRPFTKNEAIKRDLSEIENVKKAGPIAYADYYIDNNKTILEYENRLQEILEVI